MRSPSPPWVLLPATQRFLSQAPGRATRHAFSFGSHYDPDNVGFGSLLACNDDRLGAGCGYGPHRHRDTEIVSWVVSGTLRHTDSRGRTGVVHPGLVQRMSAGAGVVHAEGNDVPAPEPGRTPEPVHFVQMWLRPDRPGGEAGYQRGAIDSGALERGWVPVASGETRDAVLRVGTSGATLWATRVPRAVRRALPVAGSAFVQVVVGTVDLTGIGHVAAGDTVRIGEGAELVFTGVHRAEVLVWTFAAAVPVSAPRDAAVHAREGGRG